MHDNGYLPPILTVDSVIFQLGGDSLEVLLIERRGEPFKGRFALPGAYIANGETTTDALARVLQAKAGIKTSSLGHIEQLQTFDTVARDPRGHAVSVTYMGLGKDIAMRAGNDTHHPKFYSIDHLPKIAFDHQDIISYAHQRLASKIAYTNIIAALLPPEFSLTELQRGYEIIFGRQLDKRNFRKKLLSLDLVEATADFRQTGAHRPARLYRFKNRSLETLARSFD